MKSVWTSFAPVIALAAFCALNAVAADNPFLRAGTAVVDISPTNFPVRVNAMFTERTASKSEDPLHTRALVLDDGAIRVAIAVVDTCMIPRDLIDRAKALASEATRIPAERMLISATHTHSAPSAMGCLGSRADPNYAAFLPGRIAESIIQANSRLVRARIGWGVTDDWEHTFNRRWIRRPDRMLEDPFGNRTVRAHMHPGHESPDALGPSGPVDPALSILALQTPDGRPLALLANYSQHYYGSPLLSSDYYGRFAQHLTSLLGAATNSFVGIMSQGTSGDLMWMDYGAPRNEIGYDAYARALGERALEVWKGIQFLDWVPLRMAERKLALNYRVPDAARLARARAVAAGLNGRLPQSQPEIYALEAIYLHEKPRAELILQALRIGELGIAAIPNEVFAITGLKLKAQSPLRPTFNIELTNGAEGYIPPPEQHLLGGYTTWPARTAGLEVQAEPRIVETLLSLLEEVSGRPRRRVEPSHGPYAESVLIANPAAYWRFEEMVIPSARDSTTNLNHALYEPGIALYLPGPGSGDGVSPTPRLTPSNFSGQQQINRAAHFAGGRVKAQLPSVGKIYTVEMWFWNGLEDTARPITGYFFSRGPDGNPQASGDHLGLGGTHQPEQTGKLIFFNGNRLNQTLAGRTAIARRTWSHVVLVRDARNVQVFLNGNPEPEISGEADLSLAEPSPEFFIGGRNDNFASFEGKLDEVAVYNRALTPAEIAAHYRLSGFPIRQAAKPRTDSPPLSPAESLGKIRVSRGFRVELVAAEPLVMDPVAFDWDTAGRLWVVEMADYPSGMQGHGETGGRVRVLEDTDGDGRYEKSTLFADELRFPNGILTWREGVLVTAAPDLLFLKDSDGDGKADVRQVLLTGFSEGNQQLRVNGLRWGLDNWVYCAAGGHHRGHAAATKITSKQTGQEIALGSRDFRFRPDTGAFDPQSGPAQFGRNRDDWGRWFGTQNILPLWHYVLADHYIRRNPHVPAPDPVRHVVTPRSPKVYPASRPEKRFHSFNEAGHFTSACSGMIYQDEYLFPAVARVQAFVCEPFHNLVHHELVSEVGVSFQARRVFGEETSEFFASEDRWCRPVMVRTGPDGALWVADMYRYMIEHPEWLPGAGKIELLPHYREGDDRGRIYRVVKTGEPPRRTVRLDKLTVPELVAALDSPNGWQRDKVQQLLLWRADKSAVPHLTKLARESRNPLARLHALCTLDGLEALAPELVLRGLQDEHPGIRENALRLAERRGTSSVIAAATRLVEDANLKVRLQLACTLGEWGSREAGLALGRLAVAHHADPFLIAAVMSSALPHCDALVEAALADRDNALQALAEPLFSLALGLNKRAALARLLEPAVAAPGGRFTVDQMDYYNRFLETLERRQVRAADLSRETPDDPLSQRLRAAEHLIAFAAKTTADESLSWSERLTAATLLAREASHRQQAVELLAGWLQPQVPLETQRALIHVLSATTDASVPRLLLSRWTVAGPEARIAMIEALLRREAWTVELLERVQKGDLSSSVFDAARRTRLTRHESRRVRELAAELFNSTAPSSRAKVVETYRPALELRGDPARGAAVFGRLCLTCHQRDGQGNEIGPDLRSVGEHPPEKLLVNILDPNAEVQPGYHAYTCTLKNGEELYGIIGAETANSVVLKLADGSTRTVLRNQIERLQGSRVSLMPEELESGMTQQDLADLIQLLRNPSQTH